MGGSTRPRPGLGPPPLLPGPAASSEEAGAARWQTFRGRRRRPFPPLSARPARPFLSAMAAALLLLLAFASPAAGSWSQSCSCDTSQLEGAYPRVVSYNMCKGIPEADILLPNVIQCLYTPLSPLQARTIFLSFYFILLSILFKREGAQ